MIDKEKLRYDLALHSAVVMTLRGYSQGDSRNPTDAMLANFQMAYDQYLEGWRGEELGKAFDKISKSE